METNTEHERDFTRMDLGIYIHSAENVKRTPDRSKEAAKVGMNILILSLVGCGWANMFNADLTPWTAALGMIYALCFIITKPENENEI